MPEPFVVALAFKLAPAISKALLKLWLDDPILEAGATSIYELIATRTEDAFAQQSGEANFKRIGREIAKSLQPLIEEKTHISDESKETIILQIANTFENHLSTKIIIKKHLNPTELYKHLQAAAKDATKLFSRAETEAYEHLLKESCEYAVDIASGLPNFTESSIAEVLQMDDLIMDGVQQILEEVRQLREQSHRENPEEQAAHFETGYLREIIRKLDHMELFGADVSHVSRRHNLSVAYVALFVKTTEIEEEFSQDNQYDTYDPKASYSRKSRKNELVRNKQDVKAGYVHRRLKRELPVEVVVAKSKYLLITGIAGSGKTTLLKWLAIQMASPDQIPNKELKEWRGRIPFFIRLRDYKNGNFPRPVELANLTASMMIDEMPHQWAIKKLESQKVVLLVDGIDEVPDEYRNSLALWLDYYFTNYPEVPIIITSRPTATKNWMAKDRFEVAELLPMDKHKIDAFIDHWYQAVKREIRDTEKKTQLNEYAGNLKNILVQRRPIRDLATSPLLCAMLCAFYYDQNQVLPKDRIQLYDLCCNTLIEKRDIARKIDMTQYPNLTGREQRDLLADLAYYLMRNGWSEIDQQQAQQQITRKLKTMPNLPRDIKGDNVLTYFLERTGILREPSSGKVDFPHRTFQEFLAAEAAMDADDVGVLINNANDDQWYETIILSAGHANTKQRHLLINELIKRGDSFKVIKQDNDKTEQYRYYLLAFLCLETVTDLDTTTAQTLAKRLAAFMPPHTKQQCNTIAKLGELAIPHLLQYTDKMHKIQSLCVYTLGLIGTLEALEAITVFAQQWTMLDLGNTRVNNITGLKVLMELQWLDLNSTQISDVNALENLTNLQRLYLSHTQISDISGLANLVNLQELDVSHTQISDISGLANLVSLQELDVSHTQIENVYALSNLKELKYLYLNSTQVSDVGIIADLINIRYLNLSATQIDEVSSLKSLVNLQELDISNTLVMDIMPLANLPKLQLLELAGTSIRLDELEMFQRQLPDCNIKY